MSWKFFPELFRRNMKWAQKAFKVAITDLAVLKTISPAITQCTLVQPVLITDLMKKMVRYWLLGAESKYRRLLKTFFFLWLVQSLKKKRDKSKFSWLALLFKHFFIKIQPNMSEQEKKDKKLWFVYCRNQAQKIFEIFGLYLRPPSSPELNPLDYAI